MYLQRNMEIDSIRNLKKHYELIRHKKFLRLVYEDFYKRLQPKNIPPGLVVELGSGAGCIKKLYPRVITSDIVASPYIDKVINAEKLPFQKNTIAAYLMLNVFHHFKNPILALQSIERTLKIGGKIIMIEPFNSWWGGLIYHYLHHERYAPQIDWHKNNDAGFENENIALPWVIFVRDRQIFSQKFPGLKITRLETHTPFLYLLSGGLTHWQFWPTSFFSLARHLDNIVSRFKFMNMFMTVELIKK